MRSFLCPPAGTFRTEDLEQRRTDDLIRPLEPVADDLLGRGGLRQPRLHLAPRHPVRRWPAAARTPDGCAAPRSPPSGTPPRHPRPPPVPRPPVPRPPARRGTARAAAPRSSRPGRRSTTGRAGSRCSASKLSTRTGSGYGRADRSVPGALDQKTPCPTSGSFSSVASRSSEKCAFARFSAARSPADSRWNTKKLSPWLSSSGRDAARLLGDQHRAETVLAPLLHPRDERAVLGSRSTAAGASTACASSTTAMHGTICGLRLGELPLIVGEDLGQDDAGQLQPALPAQLGDVDDAQLAVAAAPSSARAASGWTGRAARRRPAPCCR